MYQRELLQRTECGKSLELRGRTHLGENVLLPLKSWVTLGKLPDFSVSRFPSLLKWHQQCLHLGRLFWCLKEIIHQKCWTQRQQFSNCTVNVGSCQTMHRADGWPHPYFHFQTEFHSKAILFFPQNKTLLEEKQQTAKVDVAQILEMLRVEQLLWIYYNIE